MGDTPLDTPTVLVVDDDPTTRITLKAVIDSFGKHVVTASSGQEALELMRTHTFSVVISDWEMPGMTGPELCRRIRSEFCTNYTYIILLTSLNASEHLVEGIEAGADDFMTKPFNPAELRVRIKSAERIEALDTMDVTIFSLAKLAESRDPETGAHLERVRQYTKMLAIELKNCSYSEEIDGEFVSLMYATSPLHDIGKVAIPDSVLLKPGQLNDLEFEIMKSHAEAGASTLMAALSRYPTQRFLQIAHDIARSHHERYDGSGYPDGLSGESIPLAARIMAVADVYDALTSKRVYKDAFSHLVAANIINEGAGSHFDPAIVLAFVRIEAEFAKIRSEYNDDIAAAA
jgi:putative two-component system response regulator